MDLFSQRYMCRNGLNISMQRRLITYNGKSIRLSFDNDFLVHKRYHEDMGFFVYVEKDLRMLHHVFGLPSVTAFANLLRSADPDNFDPGLKRVIDDITEACDTCVN